MHPQTEPLLSSWHREGFEKGVAQTLAANVLDVLEARGLTVSDEQRARVLACSDLEQLKRWLRRAAVVAEAHEIFD